MPAVTGTVDLAPLDAALKTYAGARKIELPKALNRAGKNVALRAVQFSPAVGAGKIAAELRVVVAVLALTKTGKTRKKRKEIHEPTTLAKAIILARLRKKGIDPRQVSAAEIQKMALKLAASRIKSANYLRAGWLPAAKAFGAGAARAGVKQWGRDRGVGILATAEQMVAELRNDVPTKWKAGSPGYEKAVAGLQRAVDYVAGDMLDFATKALDAAAAKARLSGS